MTIDRGEFRAWLEAQGPCAQFHGNSPFLCPIAQYLSDNGKRCTWVATLYYSVDGEIVSLPDWAENFVAHASRFGQMGARDALRLLDKTYDSED